MKADVSGQSQPDGTCGSPPGQGERGKVLKRASKSYRTPGTALAASQLSAITLSWEGGFKTHFSPPFTQDMLS